MRAKDVSVRYTRPEDIEQVVSLQKRVYPTIPAFRPEQLENHLSVFPKGQLVAVMGERVVGTAASLVVLWDDYGLNHTWAGVTGSGSFDTHDLGGFTLYGAEVCVDPRIRGRGVGHKLYQARRRICRTMNLKRIIAGGRLPGFHRYAHEMTAEYYAMKVVWGDIYDPVLRFQLNEGFQFCGVIPQYLPSDTESCGNATVIVWLNPLFNPKKPTRLP